MRTLVSAIALAGDADAVLRVVWKADVRLSCRFEDLFEWPPGLASIHHVGDGFFYRVANYVVCKCFPNRLEQVDVEAMNKAGSDFVGLARSGHRVFIRTHSGFYRDNDFSLLHLASGILNVVKGYGIERSKTIGVHIRRTDNKISATYSPTKLFLSAMETELEHAPETVFFVATDSPQEEECLKVAFPGKIITHRKSTYDRTDPQAIRDAAVDLYALASCRKIFGSYWSSFSDTAAAIYGIPLQILRYSDETDMGYV